MPQIAPNLWKVAAHFFWWREYLDGRIEREFDLETGQIRPWGSETPKGLRRAGWQPITSDLSKKMWLTSKEFGLISEAPAMLVDLKPEDELVIFKEATIYKVSYTCKACGQIIQACEKPAACPRCGVAPAWKCDTCGKLQDTKHCPACKRECRRIDPIQPVPGPWEDVTYHLGIKGKFVQKFNCKQSIIS